MIKHFTLSVAMFMAAFYAGAQTPCQADAPSATNLEMCTYDNIPSFKISRGSKSVASHDYQIYVFTSQATYPLYPIIVSSSSMVYDPTAQIAMPKVAGMNQFWIAEYDLTDKCMGRKSEITLLIKDPPAPVAIQNTPFCQASQASQLL